MIREPAVAGSFYPASADALQKAIEQHLADAEPWPDRCAPKALIAPHAGYVYSGPIAGNAFSTLDPAADQIRRVVLIGPSHFLPFRGIAVPSVTAFRTPLGDVPVDHNGVEMAVALPEVREYDLAHLDEHALEVELPFLQVLLGRFSLVPLVVGAAGQGEVAQVLARLWGGGETVIVVSSDLSHYHDDVAARRQDATTATAIEMYDAGWLGPDHACGHLAVGGLLIEAQRRRLNVERRDLRNSGETAGPRDRVVGYGAWAFCCPG